MQQPKLNELKMYSDIEQVFKNAKHYLGDNVQLYVSTKSDKKFMVLNPDTNKFVHFGGMGYEDYTKHQDEQRKERYLKRALNIKGRWKDDPYSANWLAIKFLWN